MAEIDVWHPPVGVSLWYSRVGEGRRVGTAGPTPWGGADPGFWGAIFLKFSPKMAFFGDVCVEKIDFFGKLLKRKWTFLGSCRENGLRWRKNEDYCRAQTSSMWCPPHLCVAACSHSVSHASTTPKFPAMPNHNFMHP